LSYIFIYVFTLNYLRKIISRGKFMSPEFIP